MQRAHPASISTATAAARADALHAFTARYDTTLPYGRFHPSNLGVSATPLSQRRGCTHGSLTARAHRRAEPDRLRDSGTATRTLGVAAVKSRPAPMLYTDEEAAIRDHGLLASPRTLRPSASWAVRRARRPIARKSRLRRRSYAVECSTQSTAGAYVASTEHWPSSLPERLEGQCSASVERPTAFVGAPGNTHTAMMLRRGCAGSFDVRCRARWSFHRPTFAAGPPRLSAF
jgi:hypothetical protein